MRALIVGANGFAGRWLTRHLRECGDTVDAIVGPHFDGPSLDGADLVGPIDVRDGAAVARFLSEAQPDAIYYLAGVSQRGRRDALDAAAGVSVVGCVNVVMAADGLPKAARFLFPSTGYVYAGGEGPLPEDAATHPLSLYAGAKLAAEHVLDSLRPFTGVEYVIARAFNHTGPGQTDAFLVPSIARQVAAVAGGETDTVRFGAASPVRDFCDVRDVVRAYRLLITSGEPGSVYNVASGTGVRIGDLVNTMVEIAGVAARIESASSGEGGDQPPVLIGDVARIEALGWHRQYSLHATLMDVLTEHRTAV